MKTVGVVNHLYAKLTLVRIYKTSGHLIRTFLSQLNSRVRAKRNTKGFGIQYDTDGDHSDRC